MPNNPPKGRKLLLILAISLLAHALLLLVPVTLSPPSSQPRPSGVTLVALPAPPTSPAPEPEPETSAQPETAAAHPEAPATASAEPASSPGATQPEPAEPTSPDTDEIRRQAMQLAGDATEEDDRTRSSTLSFRPAPRLPGATGWMDTYVGTVAPSREHWQAADGGMHSRIVASNGRVVCASIRPSTVQEFFNPSMSAAVTMLRDCGRERPEPRQVGDPWERAATD